MTPASQRRLWRLLALAGLAFILRLTLVPTSAPDTGTFHWCLICGEVGLSDAIGNLALFVPLALGLRGSGVSGRTTVAVALLLSTSIEMVQLFVPGRESALGDIVANTAGAGAVVLLGSWWPSRRSGPAGMAAAAATLALVGGIGWALRPSFPPTVYYGQWTAELGQYATYRGKVLSASIGGLALPDGRLEDTRAVRERLSAGEALEVRGVAGPRTRRLAPLFSIADDGGRGILLVGPDGGDLVLLLSTKAIDLHLNRPDLRWRGAMDSIHAGDSLVLAVRRNPDGYCLTLNSRGRCGMGYTAGRAWALVQYPPGLPAAVQTVLDGLFMALLGLPVGLLIRRNAAGVVTAVTAVAGVAVLPSLMGLSPTPALQLAALASGLAAAALIP
jgi:hypothetical protein